MNESNQKSREWKELLSKWQDSGKSGQRFCLEHQIKYYTFCYWKNKLGGQSLESDFDCLERHSFAELPNRLKTRRIEIKFSGVKLLVTKKCDPSALASAIACMAQL